MRPEDGIKPSGHIWLTAGLVFYQIFAASLEIGGGFDFCHVQFNTN
jgi:hypothetical protein